MRLMLAMLLGLMITPVNAHDAEHPELDNWYMSLHNKLGGSCCGNADGQAISADDWKTANGHYKVFVNNSWYDVPDYAVLDTEPNKAGHAIVWISPQSGSLTSAPGVICFMPGAMY